MLEDLRKELSTEIKILTTKITTLEDSLNLVKSDVAEILVWVRGGKRGAEILSKSVSLVKRTLFELAKLLSAIVAIYLSLLALHEGSIPDIKVWLPWK